MNPAQHATSAMASLTLMVLALSSFGPAAKFVLTHSDITPLELACARILIGFLFLCLAVFVLERPCLVRLTGAEIGRLSTLGLLCVGIPYALSAWGLQLTTVTNYVLIYSLVPSFTALFSHCLGKERLTLMRVTGILLSCAGCLVAVSQGLDHLAQATIGLGLGEGLVALFALMMSASIVASAGLVMRFGALTANTVMFGSSLVVLLIGILIHEPAPDEPISLLTGSMVLYIGITTAGVFLLRFCALRSLSPSTVGAFHNLVPVLTILLAVMFLREPLQAHTILGTLGIIAGVELVRRGKQGFGGGRVLPPVPESGHRPGTGGRMATAS